ncbi:DUF934 domain-containing protein [Altererythrobacter aurantiacus]|uniref:DUF934 domain-containing protein n=1 Tax=Parapontixanthobacter aurantiacus TaxID=1463599 RepID=A0A844ZG68_9SPHN|nr:DUF934 domain-containing protein [Parapontixanthobacter aurantiacus]MXO84719.1 DUF934 domain-containing protein [Parapontixanthobacter aurantiacus]
MAEGLSSTQTPAEGRGPLDATSLRFRDDDPVLDPAVTVDAFTAQGNAVAVRIEPGDDVRELLPSLDRLALVEINFPTFGDGRGYSAARILREAGYRGELRAVGDVLVDQIAYLRRCGFDAFAPEAPLDPDDVAAALDRFPHVYQPAADERNPIWNLRHGKGEELRDE